MKKKDFSIKSWKFAFAWVVLIGGAAFGVLFVTINNNLDSKAVRSEEALDIEHPSGVIFDEYEKEIETYIPKAARSSQKRSNDMMGVDGGSVIQATEKEYDTRDTIHTVRTKNQGGEGLCWAYSATTAIEYFLAKDNVRAEFSPKVMDYRFVDAKNAYNEEYTSNAYYAHYVSANNSWTRTLGTGATSLMMMFVFSDPLALVRESDFVGIIRENDSRLIDLGITNSYDELWSKDYSGVTTTNQDLVVYDKKQSFSKINNINNANYVVTGLEYVQYPYYGGETQEDSQVAKRSEVIQDIKNMIKTYGAVNASVSTNWDPADGGVDTDVKICGYETGSVRVFIDKGDVCNGGGHAITLVGWDDDFGSDLGNYPEGKGAFIVQNSWGDDGFEYYMSYNSELSIRNYYDLEEYGSHDNVYSLIDYQEQTETPTAREHIFEFKSDKKEKLSAFTFTEYPSHKEYSVMINLKGTDNDADYQRVGEELFSTHVGINEYVFENDVVVDGNYKIKLSERVGLIIDNGNRFANNMIVFTDDVYELSFDVAGGESEMDKQYCEPGDNGKCKIVISKTKPNREGYSFLGWSESAGTTKVDYQPGDEVLMGGDKVLYAVWKKTATITFNSPRIVKYYGDDDFTNGVTINSDGDVTYSIDRPDVAMVDNTGLIKIVGIGTATVTASVAETDQYTAASRNYTLRVKEKTSTVPEIGVKEGYVAEPLSTITLDINGLSWVDDTIVIEEGLHSYNAKYTENNDTEHYTTEEIQITVNGIRRTYEAIDGDEQVYVIDSGEYVEFRFDADYSSFTEILVYIDDVLLDAQNYNVKSGSIIVQVLNDYLQTLPVGEHAMAVYLGDSGVARASFTIKEKEVLPVPDTGSDDPDGPDDPDNPDDSDDNDDTGDHEDSDDSDDSDDAKDSKDSNDSEENIAVPDTGVMNGGGSDAAGGITIAVGLLAIGAMGYVVARNRKSIFHKVGFDKSR